MSPTDGKNEASDGENVIGKTPVGEAFQKRARKSSLGKIFWYACFVLAILSLVSVVAISRRSGEQLRVATRAVIQTREVLEKLGTILARLSEVESAARSFAISGKQSHLNPFYTAAKAVPLQVDELKLVLRDDPVGLRSVTEIEPVISGHLKVMKAMVELGKKNLFRGSAQRSLTDEGKS